MAQWMLQLLQLLRRLHSQPLQRWAELLLQQHPGERLQQQWMKQLQSRIQGLWKTAGGQREEGAWWVRTLR